MAILKKIFSKFFMKKKKARRGIKAKYKKFLTKKCRKDNSLGGGQN
jgi:hypothetical protein